MEHLTDFERGWLVGIIEADGCVQPYNNGSARIVVKMTDKDTITRAAVLLGVNILGPYRNKMATVSGRPRKDGYVMAVNGVPAERFLRETIHQFSFRRQRKIAVLLNLTHLKESA